MTQAQSGELAILAAALVVPPILIFSFRYKILAFFIGVVWFWGMLVACGQWLLATDPEYDSIAPMVAVVMGWAIGLIYCAPWFFVAWGIKAARHMRARRLQKASHVANNAPPNPTDGSVAAGDSEGPEQ